jgi:putative phosphoribosyl transferase
VGEYDHPIRELNEQAARRMPGIGRVAVVPDAGHLFDERGAMDVVTELARGWFREHLAWQPVGRPAR